MSFGSSMRLPGTMFSERQPRRVETYRMPVSGSAAVGPKMFEAPLGHSTNERSPDGCPRWIGGLKIGPRR